MVLVFALTIAVMRHTLLALISAIMRRVLLALVLGLMRRTLLALIIAIMRRVLLALTLVTMRHQTKSRMRNGDVGASEFRLTISLKQNRSASLLLKMTIGVRGAATVWGLIAWGHR